MTTEVMTEGTTTARTIRGTAERVPGAAGTTRQSRELLAAAARSLLAAAGEPAANDRFARAHLAALRASAALLASLPPAHAPRGGPRSAWVLVAEAVPELGEWVGFFAAGAAARAAAEAGVPGAVSEREADDLVRAAEAYLAVVAARLGQPTPVTGDQLLLAG